MPVDLATLAVFVPIALALNLTPGADMLFCLGQGARSGPAAGVAASLGVSVGVMLHALAAGLGLAALIAAHPLAFEAIRWSGVAYLVWLAWGAFREPGAPAEAPAAPGLAPAAAFRRAVLVNVLNPKVALFILALMPQFVEPARGAVVAQFLILGGVIALGGAAVNGAVGASAGALGRRFAGGRGRAARIMRRLTGLVFLALAARLAFDRR